MELFVNGEPRMVAPGASVEGLLAGLSLEGRKVAVERNLEIVPRSLWAATTLAPGDRIEVVAFVGGG